MQQFSATSMDWNLDDILQRIQIPQTPIQSSNRLLQDLVNRDIIGNVEEDFQDHSIAPYSNDNWNGSLCYQFRREKELESHHRYGNGHLKGSILSSSLPSPPLLTKSSEQSDPTIIPPPFEYQDNQKGNDQASSLASIQPSPSPSMSPAFPNAQFSYYSPAYPSSVQSSTITEPSSPFLQFDREQVKQPQNTSDRSPGNLNFDQFPDISYSPSFYNSPNATPTWNDKTYGSLRGAALTRRVELSPRSPRTYLNKDVPTPKQNIYDDFDNDLENIQSFSPFNIVITSPDSVLETSRPQLQSDNLKVKRDSHRNPNDNRTLSSRLDYMNETANGPSENFKVSNLDQRNSNDTRTLSSKLDYMNETTNGPSENLKVSNLDQFILEDGLAGFSERIFTAQNKSKTIANFNILQNPLLNGDTYKIRPITNQDYSSQRSVIPDLNVFSSSKNCSSSQENPLRESAAQFLPPTTEIQTKAQLPLPFDLQIVGLFPDHTPEICVQNPDTSNYAFQEEITPINSKMDWTVEQESAQLLRQSTDTTFDNQFSNDQSSRVVDKNQIIPTNRIENPDPPSIVKLFKCSLCEKKFLDRNNLQLHSKLHMDPTDFECEICHCFFHTKNGLKVHKSNMHRHSKRNREIRLNCEKSKIVSKCKKCPSVFRNKAELRHHYLEKHNKRPFPCPKCSHRSRTDERLKQHILSHLVDEESICPYCDKKFHSKNSLNRHLNRQKCDFLKELSQTKMI